MYFTLLPSVAIDVKPIRYPFSESDFVVAKNFFRRYKLSDTAFNSAVYYKQYAINDDVRLDQIADAVYGNSYYDWVIALVNNMINPLFDLPMSENDLRKHVESSYSNPYYDIHHYVVINKEEQISKFGQVIYPPDTIVDETFYNNKITLEAAPFPNLTPNSETITSTDNFIFDEAEKDTITYESFNSYRTSVTNLSFVPVLRDDGFRSSTQVVLGNGGPGSQQYVITNPIDTSTYDTIKVYAGKINSPEPGETLKVGYILNGGALVDAVYFADILDYTMGDGVYNITESLPEAGRAPDTKIIFMSERDTTGLSDLFAIQSFILEGSYVVTTPLDFEWNKIDDDNYVIDSISWTKVGGNWYKKVSTGFRYYENSTGDLKEVASSELSRPVNEFEFEQYENEKKREIFILKPKYLQALVDDFKKAALYKQSSDFVSNQLKRSGV
jgi:hypothetical protein